MEIYKDITSYIEAQPKEYRRVLEEMRDIVRKAAPNAEKAIRYGMPTFRGKGNIVHFALMKKHLGFYPSPSGITNFGKELAKYVTSKGAIQLPLDKPLPKSLITKIVKFRAKEDAEKDKKK